MKTKFIYVIMAVLLMGSQMTLSAQNTDNKQKNSVLHQNKWCRCRLNK